MPRNKLHWEKGSALSVFPLSAAAPVGFGVPTQCSANVLALPTPEVPKKPRPLPSDPVILRLWYPWRNWSAALHGKRSWLKIPTDVNSNKMECISFYCPCVAWFPPASPTPPRPGFLSPLRGKFYTLPLRTISLGEGRREKTINSATMPKHGIYRTEHTTRKRAKLLNLTEVIQRERARVSGREGGDSGYEKWQGEWSREGPWEGGCVLLEAATAGNWQSLWARCHTQVSLSHRDFC